MIKSKKHAEAWLGCYNSNINNWAKLGLLLGDFGKIEQGCDIINDSIVAILPQYTRKEFDSILLNEMKDTMIVYLENELAENCEIIPATNKLSDILETI